MALLYDQETEQIVLGTIINNPSIYNEVCEFVNAEDFFYENHRIVYKAIADEIDVKNNVDLLTIVSHLRDKELLDKIGNRSFLAKVADLNSPLSAVANAQKVKDFSLRRQFFAQLKDIEKNTNDPGVDLDEVLLATEKALQMASVKSTSDDLRHLKESRDEFIEYIKQLQVAQGGITGTASGFRELDDTTGGFKPGQLIILAARPGVGKTTMALNIAQHIALKEKVPVAFFTLEMGRIELIVRLVCSDIHLDSKKFQRGTFSQRESERIVQSFLRHTSAEIYIDETPSLSAFDFKRKSRQLNNKLKRESKELKFIVVDYLQLMTDPIAARQGRQQEIQNISRDLKLIAKELNVTVLALSQMNRSIEQRGKDPEPQLSDLRESGSIEQDADMVIFLHGEGKDAKEANPAMQDMIKVKIAKHRAGKLHKFDLHFKGSQYIFSDVEKMQVGEMAQTQMVGST